MIKLTWAGRKTVDTSENPTLRPLRQEARQSLEFRTTLRSEDGLSNRFVMRNISHGGFMGDSEIAHKVGAEVSLHLPVIGAVQARVKWVDGHRIGCQMLDGLTFREVFFLLLLSQADEIEATKNQQKVA